MLVRSTFWAWALSLAACTGSKQLRQQQQLLKQQEERLLLLTTELSQTKRLQLKQQDSLVFWQQQHRQVQDSLRLAELRASTAVVAAQSLQGQIQEQLASCAALQQRQERLLRQYQQQEQMYQNLRNALREAWPEGEEQDLYEFGKKKDYLILKISTNWLYDKNVNLRSEASKQLELWLPTLKEYNLLDIQVEAYHSGQKTALKNLQTANYHSLILAQWLVDQGLELERIKAQNNWLQAPKQWTAEQVQREFNRVELIFVPKQLLTNPAQN
jgi:hypothetical protein